MSSKPKIVVVKMREIIYTLLLLFLVILLILCLVLMFTKKTATDSSPESTAQSTPTQEEQTPEAGAGETPLYTAGVYTTPVTLGDSTVDVEVTVDQNHINGIRLVNLSEAVLTAYPLVSPSLEHLTSQILETQTLEGITCPRENRYTSQILLSAISDALDLARNPG